MATCIENYRNVSESKSSINLGRVFPCAGLASRAHKRIFFHSDKVSAFKCIQVKSSMTAAVVSLPMPLQAAEFSADARKRRREILTTQRTIVDALPKICQISSVSSEVTAKRRKVSDDGCKKTKKPQMKYDPDVPMTKEEAAVWRREQRRKRNRESAAASRQRQRDRITELEIEVDGWKQQYDTMMKKIEELEKEHGKCIEDYMTPEQSRAMTEAPASIFVSPPSSPGYSPLDASDAEPSPVASSSLLDAIKIIPDDFAKSFVGQVEDEHSDKMISRQAAS